MIRERAYLARYTHRVAIANSRLIALRDGAVTFRWKDYRIKGRDRQNTMTLPVAEFIRAFSFTSCRAASIAFATTACWPAAPTPAPVAPRPQVAATGAGQFATDAQARAHCPSDTVVWVNTKSNIYHFAGKRDYGNTKQGAYMCEADARKPPATVLRRMRNTLEIVGEPGIAGRRAKFSNGPAANSPTRPTFPCGSWRPSKTATMAWPSWRIGKFKSARTSRRSESVSRSKSKTDNSSRRA